SLFVAELERRVAEGAATPWGVQLSAGFSRPKALALYASLERRYRSILEGRDPAIIRSRLLSRGTSPFYQVRVGAHSREAADKLCASLRAAGGPCEQRLQLVALLEHEGYHAYHLAEHHSTPLGTVPCPSVFLAALAQRTKRIGIGPLVYVLPLHHPLRLFEEICMLDHLSGGR